MDEIKLKSCPFCGGIPDLWQEEHGYWYIDCNHKYCKIKPEITIQKLEKNEAISIWNTRFPNAD